MKKIFGPDTIDMTGEVAGGLDEEGEPRGMYRPSGHPGVGLPTERSGNELMYFWFPFSSSGTLLGTSSWPDSIRSPW